MERSVYKLPAQKLRVPIIYLTCLVRVQTTPTVCVSPSAHSFYLSLFLPLLHCPLHLISRSFSTLLSCVFPNLYSHNHSRPICKFLFSDRPVFWCKTNWLPRILARFFPTPCRPHHIYVYVWVCLSLYQSSANPPLRSFPTYIYPSIPRQWPGLTWRFVFISKCPSTSARSYNITSADEHILVSS